VRHLVFADKGRVEWREADDPGPPDGHSAVVRPLAVARCDFDVPAATGGIFPGPYPVGHETVAEVIAVGGDVSRWQAGDRVLVPFQVSCGSCRACLEERYGGCRTYRAPAGAVFGFGSSGGGFGGAVADLMAVPAADHMLVAAPAGVTAAILCTLPDNVVDAYRTVGPQLAAYPGADVLVVGGGAPSIGLYAVSFAAALGARDVRYVDSDAERCAVAQALGAEATHHGGPWPHRFPKALVTVDNSGGDASALATTLRSTDDYGICTSVAIYFAPSTPVPLLDMYTRGITFQTSRADSRRYLSVVTGLVANDSFKPASVPTTVVPWDEAADAWLKPAIKLVLDREAADPGAGMVT
jgi:threonine dehydrogenase-like Zn-dependent dehydrogenase